MNETQKGVSLDNLKVFKSENDKQIGVILNSKAEKSEIPATLPANGGNANTAERLKTSRKINGVDFDGSADITVPAVDSTARTAAANAQNTAEQARAAADTNAAAITSTAASTLSSANSYTDTMAGALDTRVSAAETAITTLNGTGAGSVKKAVSDGIANVVAGAPTSFDTLKEISDWIGTHTDSAAAMNTQIQTNSTDISALQTAKADKSEIPTSLPANGGNAATVNGHTVNADVPANAKFTDTTYTAATVAPKANGAAAVGTSAKYAREDHVHPLQTSVSGNAGTAAKLQTARKINGVAFDGTADITVTAVDSTARTAASNAQTTANGKFDKTGGTISGDVRIKNNTNYGAKLNFGELEYAYLHEDTDDHLKIYANNGIAIIGDNGVTIDTNETGLTIDGVKYSPLGVTPYMCGNVDLNSLGRDDPGCILFYNIDQAAYSITNGINGGGMRGWIIHADYSRGLFGVQFYMNYTGTMLYRRYYTYDSSKPYNRSFGEWVRLSWFS